MKTFAEEAEEFFNNTSPEKVLMDWEKSVECDKAGITVYTEAIEIVIHKDGYDSFETIPDYLKIEYIHRAYKSVINDLLNEMDKLKELYYESMKLNI